jgi:DNA-binding response OmpR family regulator
VLIVEDDPAIAEGLSLNLRLHGYQPAVAGDGEAAAQRLSEKMPDLVLLDISLPRKNGLELLSELREAQIQVPVIVLSARQDEFDKVAALRLGADDYVTKPFALAELLARVDAVLRRAGRAKAVEEEGEGVSKPSGGKNGAEEARAGGGTDGGKPLAFGAVRIEPATRTVTRDGASVKVTHLEFELLVFLVSRPARVFSREELLREVWGYKRTETPRTVDNFIAQLRSKLEENPEEPRYLVTVRGSGYRFAP